MQKKISKSVPNKIKKQLSGAPAFIEGDFPMLKRSMDVEARRAFSVQLVSMPFKNSSEYRANYDDINWGEKE